MYQAMALTLTVYQHTRKHHNAEVNKV